MSVRSNVGSQSASTPRETAMFKEIGNLAGPLMAAGLNGFTRLLVPNDGQEGTLALCQMRPACTRTSSLSREASWEPNSAIKPTQ